MNKAISLAAIAFTIFCLSCGDSSTKDSFVDSRDGQKYKTVKIGNQTWMAENLNFNADSSLCYNCKKYGRLYNWNLAMKVCPSGWHLPTRDEWDVLSNSAGDSSAECKHLKECGFAALPGGISYSNGSFDFVGERGYWWSNNEYNSNYAYGRGMDCKGKDAGWNWGYGDKGDLFSVRCIQD
jgi:uncharacterized protein (TIGR02145 family)